MKASAPAELLRIPGDLANAPGSRWLNAGDLCFGEYHQAIQQKPRNVFVTEHTLIFVMKGAKVFRFPEEELVVGAGKAIFLKRGCYLLCESVRDNNSYESMSVFFNEAALRDFWLSLPMDRPVRGKPKTESKDLVVLSLTPALQSFRETITDWFGYEGRFLERLINVKLQELVLLLLETSNAAEVYQFFDEIYASSIPDPVFSVSQNLLTPLDLEDYARLAKRSLSKFKRDFRERSGQSPGKWIQKKRLEHARMLAQSTQLTISEICAHSGFNNLSHFIRAYKTEYGRTPTREREGRA